MAPGCRCPRARAGDAVGARSWDDMCPVHGVGTAWFQALPRLPFGYAGERGTARAQWLWFRQGLPQDRRPARDPGPGLSRALSRCRACQDWYRDFAEENQFPVVACVGSLGDGTDPVTAAGVICAVLGIDPGGRTPAPRAALAELIGRAESAGFLVLAGASAGPGPAAALDHGEFASIALADRTAPLVFLNSAGRDPAALAAALLHALARLWAGESSVDRDGPGAGACGESGRWCREVAREILLPAGRDIAGRDARQLARELTANAGLIARLGGPGSARRGAPLPAGGPAAGARALRGGDPVAHVSPGLVQAVAASAAAGETLYRDAFMMLGVPGQRAFDELAGGLDR